MNNEDMGKQNLLELTYDLYSCSDGCDCQNVIKQSGMIRVEYMLSFLDISIKKITRDNEDILVHFKDVEECKKKTVERIKARILELIDFLSITDKEWKDFVKLRRGLKNE